MNGEPPKLLDDEVLELLRDAIGDSLERIIKLYLQDVPLDLQKMQQALASSDLTTLHRLAHSLKASSANLGAMQTSALAAELEHAIKDGETDPIKLQAMLQALNASFDQVRFMLQKIGKNN